MSEAAPGADRARLRAVRLLAAGLMVIVVAWLVVNLAAERGALATLGPQGRYALAIVGVVDKALGALVLFLLAADGEHPRLRWVGSGMLVFGIGPFVFNLLSPLAEESLDLLLYRRMFVWAFAYGLFVVGLLPRIPPRFSWRRAAGLLAAFGVLAAGLGAALPLLPTLATADRREISASLFDAAVQPGLTAWHFVFSAIPLTLALVAAYGAVTRGGAEALRGWLVAAMVLLAGSQLHYLLWPLVVGSVLTATFILHFVAGTAVLLGGIVELWRIAAERSRLLAVEREHSRRMRELSVLKADFTAMVAHELGSPLTAIRGYADMLSTGELERDGPALDAIRSEIDRLNALVSDVRAAAAVERDDFAVHPAPVELNLLLADAAGFARSLPGGRPLVEKVSADGRVVADAERVGQVLRNLIDNAARYSPEGAPIELRATSVDGTVDGATPRVRVEVADRGPGIHPDDLGRVFEKFARGGAAEKAPGAGLGLYLSRRIVQAHGGELTVDSTPGKGSVFSFELERAG